MSKHWNFVVKLLKDAIIFLKAYFSPNVTCSEYSLLTCFKITFKQDCELLYQLSDVYLTHPDLVWLYKVPFC